MNTNKTAVIGLGSMGSVLAKLLIANKQEVYIWNRSPEKAKQPGLEGATYSVNMQEVIAQASLIIICVKDYPATIELLNGVSLEGKTIVQFSTGTPQDARQLSKQLQERGAAYLDGALLATPSQMGRPDTPIFLAGSEKAFRQHEASLKILGGTILYQGEDPGTAATFDLAILQSMFGMMTGFLHGARMMEAEGMKVADLGNMIGAIAPVLGQMIQATATDIQNEQFADPESSITICRDTFVFLSRHARESKIDATVPEFLLQLFNKAVDAGYGQDRISAMIKVFRPS